MKAVAFLVAGCVWAQTPAPPEPRELARMEGQVIADANNLPLRRAQVTLRPLEAGRPAIATTTDDQGRFLLRELAPGAYQLTAERDGYLTSATFQRGNVRLPPRFQLSRGDNITGIVFRLRPWAVISGRIRYDDGDPAVNVRADLYRQYHRRGRSGFARVASGFTNDRGEYRIHGLAPGAYYVAAYLEGDRTGPDVEDQPRLDPFGREVAQPSYATTFFPDTTKLSSASPVRLRESDDITGIDIYLRPVERVRLGGRITDGITGVALTSASLILERMDAGNTGTLPAPAEVKFERDGRFGIPNVAPGLYQIWVDATSEEGPRLSGRQTLLVTNTDIDNLEVIALPVREWSGVITTAPGSAPLPPGYTPHVVLEPRSERAAVLTPTVTRSEFTVQLDPNETYDIFIDDFPDNFYLSEVRVGGGDARSAGLRAGMAGSLPFEIVLDSRGGRVSGVVMGERGGFGEPVWSGATLALIPEPPRGRLQHYRESYANEFGIFSISGVPPGRYILTAWLDQPTCDVYDEEALDPCRYSGAIVDVTASSQREMEIRVRAVPGR